MRTIVLVALMFGFFSLLGCGYYASLFSSRNADDFLLFVRTANKLGDRFTSLQKEHTETITALSEKRAALTLREKQLQQSRVLERQQSQTLQAQSVSLDGLKNELGGVKLQLSDLKKLGGEPLPKDFINSLLQATARIRCITHRTAELEHFRSGSASLIGRYPAVHDELVLLTNAHVLDVNEDTGKYECEVIFGEDSTFRTVVRRRVFQDRYDFALLTLGESLPGVLVTPVSYNDFGIGFCEFRDVEQNDAVTVVSFPQFQGPASAISEGRITNFIQGPIYEITAPIDHGSSGGIAILNKKRCALGMTTWKGVGQQAGFGYIQSWPMMLGYK